MHGWESFCDRGPDCQRLEFANGTLSTMLNKFAFEFQRSLKSLLAETNAASN